MSGWWPFGGSAPTTPGAGAAEVIPQHEALSEAADHAADPRALNAQLAANEAERDQGSAATALGNPPDTNTTTALRALAIDAPDADFGAPRQKLDLSWMKGSAPGYTPETWFPGPKYTMPPQFDPALRDPNMELIEKIKDSCTAKVTIAGVGGLVFGGMFGLFLSSMETSPTIVAQQAQIAQAKAAPVVRGAPATPTQHLIENPSVKDVMKGTWQRMKATGKNFSQIGMMFVATECAMESYTGHYGLNNTFSSGFITGGLLGLRAGVQPAIVGGLGFGFFSLVIDLYMK